MVMEKFFLPKAMSLLVFCETINELSMFVLSDMLNLHLMSFYSITASDAAIILNYCRGWYYLMPLIATYLLHKYSRYNITLLAMVLSLSGYVIIIFAQDHVKMFYLGLALVFSIGLAKSIIPAMQFSYSDLKMTFVNRAITYSYWLINGLNAVFDLIVAFTYQKSPSASLMIVGSIMLCGTLVFALSRSHYNDEPRFNLETHHSSLFQIIFYSAWRLLAGDGKFQSIIRNNFGIKNLHEVYRIIKMIPFFIGTILFFVCYEQIFSSFAQHHIKMDRQVGSWVLSPTQLRAIQPLLVILLTPLIRLLIAPMLDRRKAHHTSIAKFRLSFIAFALAFAYLVITEFAIERGYNIWVAWDIVPYFFMTIGEIFGLIYGLQFCLTYAPINRKVTANSIYFLNGFFGSIISAIIANCIGDIGSKYFLIFLFISIVGVVFTKNLTKKEYYRGLVS